VAPKLHRLGRLAMIDTMLLAAHCRWRSAEETLARIADNDSMHGLLVKAVDGNVHRNPLIKIAADAASDMLRFAGKFGLTPVARSRLAGGIYGQPGPGNSTAFSAPLTRKADRRHQCARAAAAPSALVVTI
jgi:P27 family predicted phage terminase small subunit